jgi:hypothetical protein
MFPHSCPFCSQRLLALPDRVGQRTICPKCLRPLTIPRPDDADDNPDDDPDIDLGALPIPHGYVPENALSSSLLHEDALADDELDHDHHDHDSIEAQLGDPSHNGRALADDEVDLNLSGEAVIPVELKPTPPARTPPPIPRPSSPPTVEIAPRPERLPDSTLRPPVHAPTPVNPTGVAGLRPLGPLTPRVPTRPKGTPGAASPGLPNGLLNGASAEVPDSPRPAPARLPRHETGMVSLVPTGVAGVDLNAEVAAKLTMRMKPPPEPAADLALTTGGWLLTSAAAGLLWLVGVFFQPGLMPFVAVLGALMLAFGFFWAAYLAGRTSPTRGLLTLLPPVALWRIWQPFGDYRHRPLRFVLTGALALALSVVGGTAHQSIEAGLASLDFERAPAPAARENLAARLTAAAAERKSDAALVELVNLADPEYRAELSAEDTPAIVAALKVLTRPETCARPDVRLKATATLLEWSEPDGRTALLRALRSTELSERRGGMALAPKWADDDTALAVAARLAFRSEESNARDALALMPSARAETGLLAALTAEDAVGLLTVAEMLERVGGQRTVDALTGLSRTADNPLVRDELIRNAEVVRKRLAAK